MIDALQIAATEETPKINFDANTGILFMGGTSISQQSDSFYEPVSKWILAYTHTPCPVTQLIVDFDFFNISSSKHLLDILHHLKSLQDKDYLITVEWHYHQSDEDMLELGQDYEMMVRLPFKYVGHEFIETKVC